MAMGSPSGQPPRTHYELWGKKTSLDWDNAPMLGPFGFTLTADITVPQGGAAGVVLATGSNLGGWSFNFEQGRPVAMETLGGARPRVYRIAADAPIAPGRPTLGYGFVRNGLGGSLSILVDGVQLARGAIDQVLLRGGGQGESMDMGRDTGGRVAQGVYAGDGLFNGQIDKVKIDLAPWAPPPAS